MKNEQTKRRAGMLKALGHPVRLTVVDALRNGERCVCELNPLVGVDQSTLSRHLAQLRQAGILVERRDGVRIFQRLADPAVLRLLNSADDVMRRLAARDHALAG